MAIKARNLIDEDDPRVSQIGHPAPPWLVNYADLMTELVCFFVILYALSAALNKNMQNAAQQIKEMIEKKEIQGQVKIDKEGLKISLEEHGKLAFFESGKAELTEGMKETLDKLHGVLYKLSEKHDIVVEGHTDNIPIATKQFASNWELSTARAIGVVKYFLGKQFSPKRLAAIGYGEYHPVALNDTEDNRRKNRRVVFFVKNEPYKDEIKQQGDKVIR
ncbi:MAG: OmpA family protein [Elusimicrobia bacterium]|nr:OmpA family protein [Elusimicrobiota bacterium]